MKLKAVSGIMLTLLLIGILKLGFGIQLVKADPRIWTVDDDGPADFSSIQEAINAASPGDTIYVYNGTYYERVVVNKSVSLIGDETAKPTINATGPSPGTIDGTYSTVRISANNVTISDFEIQNPVGDYGIFLDHSSNSIVNGNVVKAFLGILVEGCSENKISDNELTSLDYLCIDEGLTIISSSNNVVTGNFFSELHHDPLYMYNSSHNYIAFNYMSSHTCAGFALDKSNNNLIVGNTLYAVGGLGCGFIGSNSNVLYHNSFIADGWSIEISFYGGSTNNTWDDGYPSGGNYWSDYEERYPNATEIDDSGIWDTPYAIDENNQDNYPLMNPLVALTIHQPEGGYLEPVTPYVSFQKPDTYYYQLNTSVEVIAHILEYFTFEHFILDGSPVDTGSASITILMDKDHTLSANLTQYGPLLPVGGIYVPVNKLELLAQYIGLTILLAVAVMTVGYVKKRKRHTEINS